MCRRLATHSNNSLRQHSKLCNFLPRASIRTLISKQSWQKQSISSIRVRRGLFPYAARSQSSWYKRCSCSLLRHCFFGKFCSFQARLNICIGKLSRMTGKKSPWINLCMYLDESPYCFIEKKTTLQARELLFFVSISSVIPKQNKKLCVQ